MQAPQALIVAAVAWLLIAVELMAADGIVFTSEAEEDANKYTLPEGSSSDQGGRLTRRREPGMKEGINVFDYYNNIEGRNPDPENNGNIAADSYHHVDDDIDMIQRLKVYRFSISWARLLPDNNQSNPNPDGVRYYNEIIDKLRSIGVEPMVTLYHFDHPQILHEKYDSWLRRDMVEEFVKYADFAFRTFGDRVRYWITVNEPTINCMLVTSGRMAPGNGSEPVGSYYTCVHHQLLAHGSAYRIYQDRYANTQQGKIGISCFVGPARPNSTSYKDIRAAQRSNALRLDICAAPPVFGDYTELLIRQVSMKSRQQNLTTSKLPEFTTEEKAMMRNTMDFVGLNIYNGFTVVDSYGIETDEDSPFLLLEDSDAIVSGFASSLEGLYTLIETWPIRQSLMYAQDSFNNVPIFITENGFEDTSTEGIHDQKRAAYHSACLREMVRTIKEAGVNVLGMTTWALIDNYEWSRGYSPKMGMVHIDYSSPNRTRTLKDSSAFYIKLVTERRVPLVLETLSEQTTPSQQSSNPPPQRTTVRPAQSTPSTPSQPASGGTRVEWTCHLFIASALFTMTLGSPAF